MWAGLASGITTLVTSLVTRVHPRKLGKVDLAHLAMLVFGRKFTYQQITKKNKMNL